MSLARVTSSFKGPLKWLFTIRWQSMKVSGKPPTNPLHKAIEMEKRLLGWLRRHWKLALILFLVVPFAMGMLMKAMGGFSIYEDYGVETVGGKVGPIWNMVWEFRGQPPGYEDTVDGILGIKKPAESAGLNGPMNIFFLPLEFILVDMMVYFPAFFNGEIDLLTNIDLFIGLISIKMGIDGTIAVVSWTILMIPIVVFIFLFVFFGGFYAVPITFWLIKNSINLLKVLILITLVSIPFILMLVVMNQEALQQEFGAIIRLGWIRNG